MTERAAELCRQLHADDQRHSLPCRLCQTITGWEPEVRRAVAILDKFDHPPDLERRPCVADDWPHAPHGWGFNGRNYLCSGHKIDHPPDPPPASPRLRITASGGGRTVQHWQLSFDGLFVANTSVPEHVEKWHDLLGLVNDQPPDRSAMVETVYDLLLGNLKVDDTRWEIVVTRRKAEQIVAAIHGEAK